MVVEHGVRSEEPVVGSVWFEDAGELLEHGDELEESLARLGSRLALASEPSRDRSRVHIEYSRQIRLVEVDAMADVS